MQVGIIDTYQRLCKVQQQQRQQQRVYVYICIAVDSTYIKPKYPLQKNGHCLCITYA